MSLPEKLVAVNDHPTVPTIWYVKKSVADIFEVAVCYDDDLGNSARLLAAAPELLAALKRCLHDDAGDLEPATVHHAWEVINKAESRVPSTPLGEILDSLPDCYHQFGADGYCSSCLKFSAEHVQ